MFKWIKRKMAERRSKRILTESMFRMSQKVRELALMGLTHQQIMAHVSIACLDERGLPMEQLEAKLTETLSQVADFYCDNLR